jgi:hypothetical protein
MIFKEIDNIRDVGVICHYFYLTLEDTRLRIYRKFGTLPERVYAGRYQGENI